MNKNTTSPHYFRPSGAQTEDLSQPGPGPEPARIRFLERRDLEQITALHMRHFAPYELSVKLGPGFVRAYYETVLESDAAFLLLYEKEGAPAVFAAGITDYTRFMAGLRRRLRFRLPFSASAALLKGRLTLSGIRDLLADKDKLKGLSYPECHFGFIVLTKPYYGKIASRAVVRKMFEEMKARGRRGCWGTADARNRSAVRWLRALGFQEKRTVEQPGRTVLLFEKDF